MSKKLILVFILACLVPTVLAEEPAPSASEKLLHEIKTIEASLKSKTIDINNLGKAIKRLTALKADADECIADYGKKVKEKEAALEALAGKKDEKESPELIKQRKKQEKESPELIKQRKQQEKELIEAQTDLATCNAMAQRVKAAHDDAEIKLQTQLAQQLLAHGENIFQVFTKHLDEPVSWFKSTWDYSKKHGWVYKAPKHQLWAVFGVMIVSILFGIAIRRFLMPVVNRVHWTSEPGGCFASSTLSSFCHDAPYLLGSVGMAVTLAIYTKGIVPMPVITALAYGLTFFYIARFIIHLGLAPYAPGKLFLNIQPDIACALAKRLKVLTIIVMLGYFLVDTLMGSSLPQYALSLARSTIRIIFAINLIWVLWLFKDLRGMLKQAWLRYGLSFVLLIAILADLSGYTNLSGWLIRSVFGSLFVIVVVLVLGRLSSDLLEGLEFGRTPWHRRMRRMIGLTPEGHITGFFWVRLLVVIGWWSLLALLLIFIWDLSASIVEEFKVIFTNGFTIGSLKVIPARIVFALVSLGVLVALSAWFQGQIRKRWLSKMPMERGAREAMVTMIGYVGVTVAIVVTLGIAGIDYTNLALVAGALSLGIGFGLQNIVNNFISGLILLFERPVKTGDWIMVGNTEGHVKQIRIRATQIQTFDRADVIVPNSELISGQVTNWMLRDPRGRIRVPIGVAYGSDTQKVKEILLEIANEHAEVVTNGSAPVPKVMFRSFGDSALDFELRCFIKNIDSRIEVISDLNFSIDAAFRDNNIEIPFPQRDLHVKEWPGKDIESE